MKKVISIVLLLLLGGLLWYLFIKPSDYTVRFVAQTFPGAINQSLKRWDSQLDTLKGIAQQGDLYRLEQQLRFGDSIHRYQWRIKPLSDSTTRVIAHIKDPDHSLLNRIQVPFQETDFVKRSKKTVLDFMEHLEEHIEAFKVTIEGEAEIPGKYMAYLPLKTKQQQKAEGMIKNFSFLTNELFLNGVQLDGPPMIEITHWDRQQDSLHFNFGQPIIRSDKLPIGTEIQYKRIFPKRALKATYNGNYITSDRAWYALMDYAKKNDIAIDPRAVEIFFNKPMGSGGEIHWKADIYLPLKEKQ
ncbi:MAG: GyrI-like domain-containing protein [Bacteroidota bacterium]